ncbi:MAG: serine/threonine protein phosphatase [Geobacteraceae bacterium GWC2_53_11]|nr:MAG: serine/threonine protein phosphatase [Geobacteraceae bacterium GWC2_53_11]
MSLRTFVIGDIHGCADTLRRLVEEKLQPSPADRIYLLGDLIDRGPDSKGVLDFIFELRKRGLTVESIRGNHEEMFLHAGDDPANFGLWALNGGLATLASFRAESPRDILPRYRTFLEFLPLYILLDEFVLVHAGLNFDLPDPFHDTEAMLWTRSPFVDPLRIGGRRLVCGHTTITREQLEASLVSDKITLDNGCVFPERPGFGNLAALELASMTLFLQPNLDL